MKKLLPLMLAVMFILLFGACAKTELAEQTATPTVMISEGSFEMDPVSSASPGHTDAEPPAETPVPTVSLAPSGEDWEGIFGDFLETNYDKLYEAFFGGIAGIGYIDLDLDGSPELLMFDAGASAAMGVQIFDIVDSEVVLVSANMISLVEIYKGDYFAPVYVNANSFADFRLLEDKGTQLRFFCVNSGNGALDFSFTELITFERGEDAVAPVSRFYKYVELGENGDIISSSYESGHRAIDEGEYVSGMEAFVAASEDMGYEAAGVFIWERADYQNGFDGFMAMVTDAFGRYIPVFD